MDRNFQDFTDNGRKADIKADNSRNNIISEDTFTTISPEPVPDDSGGYILIPLIVLFGIFILSALVCLMARNRRRLEHICPNRRHTRRLRHDDNNDDDSTAPILWDEELDDPTEYLFKGKLQIETRYDTYATTNAVQHRSTGESC